MIVTCPHCGVTVRPDTEGVCPACRKPITQFEYFAGESVQPDTEERDRSLGGVREGRVSVRAVAAGAIELRSRRRGLIGIVAGALLCLILGAQAITGQGNLLIYGFLVFVGMMLLAQIRLFLFPPRLAVRGGWFEARGLGAFRVPVPEVVDLRLVNRHPLVFLKSSGSVEPAGQREALARMAATRGFHFALPKGSFTAEQIARVRQALALPPLVNQPPAPDEVFESLLKTLTPLVLVTPVLVAANMVIYALLCLKSGGWAPNPVTMIDWGANFAPKTLDGQWWRLFTSMFLHWSVIHLGFNMWILWDVGRIVERLLGNTAFLTAYMASGFFGSVASVFWGSGDVSAGASGAVFGIFGVLLGFLLPRRDSIPMEVIREHRSSVIAFLVLNLLLGLSIPYIDMAAHGGGLVAGFVFGLLLTQKLSPDRRTARRVRTAVVGVVAVAACVASARYLPELADATARWRSSTVSPEAILARFAVAEPPILERFGRIASETQRGQLTAEEAAQRVESEVLPPWREALGEVRIAIRQLSEGKRSRIQWLVDYATLREEGWELFIQGLHENDVEKMREYREKFRQADELVRSQSK